jgi:hypothetical protein
MAMNMPAMLILGMFVYAMHIAAINTLAIHISVVGILAIYNTAIQWNVLVDPFICYLKTPLPCTHLSLLS